MVRALHRITSPSPDLFNSPPMTLDVEEHDLFSPLFFQEGSAALEDCYDARLGDIAAVLEWFSTQRVVEVRGHADDGLPAAEAQALSLQRAELVVERLVALGVRPGLLRTRGMGETQHASRGHAPLQRAVNRRVELQLVVAAKPGVPSS